MQAQNRREFLSKALAAGAGATLLSPFQVGSAQASSDASTPTDIDPGFAAGEVVAVGVDGTIKVLDYDGSVRQLVVQPGSRVWKAGAFERPDILAEHDCIYARGAVNQSDSSLIVDSLWANISSFPGTVQGRTSSQLTLQLTDGTQQRLGVVAATESDLPHGESIAGSVMGFAIGAPVQAVVFSDPETKQLTASRVIALETPGAPDPAVNPDVYNTGIASFFCCGNVSGCGTCHVGSGGGACGGCRSDRFHMAWPKLTTGCGPYCGNCCLRLSFPRVACNTQVYISSVCRNQSALVYVKDCGPTVHCRSNYGCGNLPKILYDLTPCAFTAVGGGLSDGLVDIGASIN